MIEDSAMTWWYWWSLSLSNINILIRFNLPCRPPRIQNCFEILKFLRRSAFEVLKYKNISAIFSRSSNPFCLY